jgi:hypothetical protein
MRRRRFLAGAAAGLAAALGPGWLTRAFGDASLERSDGRAGARDAEAFERDRAREVQARLARARRAGLPLLVLVVPRDDARKWERGQAFGEWLNHGSEAELAPLARVEVVCAAMRELPLDGGVVEDPEPWMVLIDPSGRAEPRLLRAELPAYAEPRARIDPASSEDELFARRVATLAGLVRDALADPTPAERAPPLAREVRRRLVDRPPPGSHWAVSSGCGTDVEETPEEKLAREAEERAEEERQQRAALAGGTISFRSNVSVRGCGMGHVPEKSRRFLWFFARRAE